MKEAPDLSGASFFCMAGYSSTPLQRKLGIRQGMTMHVLEAPSNYFDLISPLPENTTVKVKLSAEQDFIHIFVLDFKVFKKEFVMC